ncbi:MAG TPA: hypothetical protein H9757_02315, partial [Candidatus Mediterraneibacter faecigallinarum]|nr:hypothetical protein [Candidatus Mediterraneibacter faecigallinarum]
TLSITLSGGSSEVEVDGVRYASTDKSISIPLASAEEDGYCTINFMAQAYITAIAISYDEPAEEYPGVPESPAAEDMTWTFETADGLNDESGNAAAGSKLEGNRGTFDGMKIDATSGKFNIQPEQTRVVINAGTVLYIPAAYDAEGASLLIAGTQDGSTPSQIKVDGVSYTTNEEIALDMTDDSAYPRFLKVEFDTIAYVNSIALNYVSDSDFDAPTVEAKDKVWDFTASSPIERPTVQGGMGEYDGIQIDAVTGKFAPRSAEQENDTQVTAGTVLYIPVAPDEKGSAITVSGNNYNNLTVTLNGTEIEVGKEAALPEVTENTYVTLAFDSADGTGSCYLTGITVDYLSDSVVNENIVTVGAGGAYDYTTIQAALDNNESSASKPLVLLIAPGTYTEHVTVDKPWVSFQPMYRDGGEIVIEESYYSSNTFDADGNFIPQDEYDVGTDKSGTVLLTSNATGFSASGITFKNSYNIDDHTAKDEQTPAVAFGSAADKVYLKDCRFIGRQDTLYLHGAGSRVQVEDCYIEGTVDFIFGDADAYFTNCDLYMAYFTGKDNGYFTAANTKKGNVGFVFSQCNLEADPAYGEDGDVSLGRPWQTEIYTETGRNADGSSYLISYDPERKNPTYENTSSAVTFIECTMDSSIQDERWNVWTRKDKDGNTVDVTYHDDVRFAEYNSKDETGAYLDPSDHTDIVLGTMATTEDAEGLLDSLLAQMGFGDGVGEWTPGFTDFSGEKPAVPDPGTDDNNNNGGAGSNGPDGSGGTTGGKNAAAKTGDTWNTAVWASAVLLPAGALLSLMRKKTRR